MEINGSNLIGGDVSKGAGPAHMAVNPQTGDDLTPAFHEATLPDVQRAGDLAWAAFDALAEQTLEERAAFLEGIAAQLEAVKERLVPRVMEESALPQARVEGELGRTVGQIRLFAAEVRDGTWMQVRLDSAMPDRAPLPRPDIRMRKVPLGPVVVFGASNFPLAFSVAGGDTASAYAAGCPVIAKAHPAHPGTSEIVGKAIQAAVKEAGLPPGTFALLHGGIEIGTALVQHPHVKAVGFTGSRGGGLAIAKVAAARPEPIPVYAEMSSINPVIVLPDALKARGEDLGPALAGSVTLGAGQFCTNPGLVFVFGEDAAYTSFRNAAAAAIGDNAGAAMLTSGIAGAYAQGLDKLTQHPAVTELARGNGASPCQPAALMETTLEAFASHPELHEEIFGAVSLLVKCSSVDDLISVLARMEGQLTATLQMEKGDTELARKLLPSLERRAGRILINGFPTGVEVCHAMVHGGPYPATSDGRSTSVGTLAIDRFLRPVCYQNFPADLLPQALRDENPFGLRRRLDGEYD